MKTLNKEIKRIWHPYWLWDEIRHNMYGDVEDHDKMLEDVHIFMKNTKLWSKYMRDVVNNWNYSCEHVFTASGNHRAWLGQAACALKMNCPEYIVKESWFMLSDEEKINANTQATMHINYWFKKHHAQNI